MASAATSAGAAATARAARKISVSRGSSARFLSSSIAAAPRAISATVSRPSSSPMVTTCSALRPHGTRVARPLTVTAPPLRASVRRSSACTGASVIGPKGTSSPARPSSQPAMIVSASGTGAVWRPEARTTTWASSHVPPAPPDSSETSGSVRPPSSSARQSLSDHVPFSAASINSLVARSVKSRVTVSPSRERRSALIGLRGGARHGPPHPPALGAPRETRGAPRPCARSSEAQPAGDDAAKDLARAAAQRERRRGLRDVAEHLLQVRSGVERRLHVEQRMHQLGDRLLERGADVLDGREHVVHDVRRREEEGEGRRHRAQRGQAGHHPADRLRPAVVGLRSHLADELADQRDRREIALGPAALEAQLGGHLLPAVAVVADARLVGHASVGEVDLVEVVLAGWVNDRPDGDALRVAQIDEKLRQPLVLL